MLKLDVVVHRVAQICVALALLSSGTAFAGTRDAGGGTGIMAGGKLIVLDLVEAGLEQLATLPAVTPNAAIVAALKKNLGLPEPLKSQVLMPLAAKLTEIDQSAHPAGITMASAFGLYTFRAVSYKLTSVDDVDSAIGETKIQLAVRKGPSIFISIPNWNQLNDVNRVALLMHEIIYAFQPLPLGCSEVETGSIFSRGTELSCNGQVDSILVTSSKARYMNSFFFRPDWKSTWKDRLGHEIKDGDFSYNALFDLMLEYAGKRKHVARYVLKDDTLTPVYSILDLSAYRKETYMTTNTSNGDIVRLCVLAEHEQPQTDWLGHATGDDFTAFTMIENKKPAVGGRAFSLSFGSDVISVENLSYEGISVNSMPQFREQCVRELRAEKKNFFGN